MCVWGGGGFSTANNQHHSNILHQYFILNQLIQEIPYTALQVVIHKYFYRTVSFKTFKNNASIDSENICGKACSSS